MYEMFNMVGSRWLYLLSENKDNNTAGCYGVGTWDDRDTLKTNNIFRVTRDKTNMNIFRLIIRVHKYIKAKEKGITHQKKTIVELALYIVRTLSTVEDFILHGWTKNLIHACMYVMDD